ncbi:MAG: hypothetical protein J6U54_01555 [Clostridiales bacterium]|nr:hypothetical protein [Clostridiales bacterium]
MYHSVTINGKNTWTDYHMVPVDGIYLPPPPNQKITTIDLKAADSNIDISTMLTGYPVFENRTGDLDYYILEPTDYEAYAEVGGTQNVGDWPTPYEIFSQILGDIHGQSGSMYFEDDPLWEYRGRFHVSSFETNGLRRRVNISYDVKPYKYLRGTPTSYTVVSTNVSGETPTIWNYTGALTPTELGIMPNNPSVTINDLPSGSTCKIRIWKPDASGNYTAGSQYYIDKEIGTVTNQTWAEFLFYRNCKLCFLGPADSSATFTFTPGRF